MCSESYMHFKQHLHLFAEQLHKGCVCQTEATCLFRPSLSAATTSVPNLELLLASIEYDEYRNVATQQRPHYFWSFQTSRFGYETVNVRLWKKKNQKVSRSENSSKRFCHQKISVISFSFLYISRCFKSWVSVIKKKKKLQVWHLFRLNSLE